MMGLDTKKTILFLTSTVCVCQKGTTGSPLKHMHKAKAQKQLLATEGHRDRKSVV